MYIDSQSDSLCLWCHSAKNRKKVGIFLLCQIQVCRAGDQRVKFLDTPFKSNEWWNPCKWTYFPKFWLKTTELGSSSIIIANVSGLVFPPGIVFLLQAQTRFPPMFSYFSPNFRHFELVDCLVCRSICLWISIRISTPLIIIHSTLLD